MSLSRDDMLRELELLPVWRLREAPIAQAGQISENIVAFNTAAPSTAAPDTAAPDAAAPWWQTSAQTAGLEVAAPELIQTADYQQSASQNATASSVAVKENANGAAERAQLIRQLDWQGLQNSVQGCVACGLAETRTQAVFGVGDPNADWLIIGEAPGAEEDAKGEPFVGQSGMLLDNMLAAIKLKRGQNVYIANVLKCQPPENREPHRDEILHCSAFLQRQIALIQPKLILALGRVAAQSMLNTDATVTSLRGTVHEFQGVPLIVTYHPAYLLRNLADKTKAWEDLCFARRTMHDLLVQAAG